LTTHVFGVDPGYAASPTGVSLLRFDGLTPRLVDVWTVRPRGREWQSRIDDALGQLLDILSIRARALRPLGPVMVSYELSYIGENPQSALRLAQMGGGVRGIGLMLGMRVVAVQPSESKLALVGRGGATKQEMIDKARQVFGRSLTEHEADACAHALAGEAKLRRQAVERKAT
jgi:Holliday junction resolvasome RuvABC endonuclease subunit